MKLSFPVSLCLLSIVTISNNTSFQPIKYIETVFNHAPKEWHAHIIKILFLNIKGHNCSYNSNLINVTSSHLKEIDLFISYASQTVIMDEHSSTVRKATGILIFKFDEDPKLPQCVVDNIWFRRIACQYIWTFNLNPILRSKLVFLSLYFESYPDCDTGNVSIDMDMDNKTSSNSIYQDMALSYCGHHSSVGIYPVFIDFKITIFIYFQGMHTFVASFDLIDKDIVKTAMLVSASTFILSPQETFFVKRVMINQYYIQVSKIYNIKLKVTKKRMIKYLIFNGPGLESDLVPFTGNVFFCSTFQCLVQVFTNETLDTVPMLSFSPVKVSHFFKKVIWKKTEVIFPSSIYNINLCILFLSAQHGYQLNVTIAQMMYKGLGIYSINCKYGGLSAGEQLNGKYKESISYCKEHDSSHALSRSMYSHNSSLILVFYWYEHYSRISVTLNISRTPCKLVQINSCSVYLLCQLRKGNCNSYLENITAWSNVQLYYPGDHGNYLVFSVPDNECFILHHSFQDTNITVFGECVRSGEDTFCSLNLLPGAVESGRELVYQITGSWKHPVVKSDFILMHNSIYLRGEVDQISLSPKENWECFGFLGKSMSRLDNKCWLFQENSDFHILAKLKTPIYEKSLECRVEIRFTEQYWFDITIWKNMLNSSEVGTIKYPSKNITLPTNFSKITSKSLYYWQQVLFFQLMKPGHHTTNNTVSLFTTIKSEIRMLGQLAWFTWDSTITFSKVNNYKFISLPAMQYSVMVLESDKMLSTGSPDVVSVTWIHDNYKKYEKFLDSNIQECTISFAALGYDICTNFSTFTKGNRKDSGYYILLKKDMQQNDFTYYPLHKKMSWVNASHHCAALGGYLPYFRNREELEEFIALHKLSKEPLFLEGIYISLNLKQSSQNVIMWKDYNVVSHQRYSNVNFGKKTLTYFHYSLRVNSTTGKSMSVQLGDVKRKVTETLYPSMISTEACSMMIITNLAEPEWISISCTEKLLGDVFCIMKQTKYLHNVIKTQAETRVCPLHFFIMKNKCYKLVWYTFKHEEDIGNSSQYVAMNSLKMFSYLFYAVSATFPKLLAPHESNVSLLYTFNYYRRLNSYRTKLEIIEMEEAKGFYINIRDTVNVYYGTNLFKCDNGGFISPFQRCDGFRDCLHDDSDEVFNMDVCHRRKVCSPLSYMSAEGVCLKYTSRMKQMTTNVFSNKTVFNCCLQYELAMQENTSNVFTNNTVFTCLHYYQIDSVLINDLVADCQSNAEDEPILVSLVKHDRYTSCSKPYELPCREGHSRCYNVTDTCSYRLNIYLHIIPCRNGGHIDNCKQFECNMMFKCRESYCIPWLYVCDGKWDCSEGEDEQYQSLCKNRDFCSHMYKCRNTRTCIHLGSVCDGYADCPYKDDESFCELKDHVCPFRCNCLILAIVCRNINHNRVGLEVTYPHIAVSIFDCFSFIYKMFGKHFVNVEFLNLQNNNINKICNEELPESLVTIDMNFNSLKIITSHCFNSLIKLQVLTLENNHINFVESHSFTNLTHLQLLSLSHNPLTNFPKMLVAGSLTFKVLIMKNNTLTDIDISAVDVLTVDIIYTGDYHICCVKSARTKCIAGTPWYKSCSNLLPNNKIQGFYILVAVLILVVNGTSILIHILTKSDKSGKAYSVTVIAINVSDLLCCIYLTIMWISDLHFGKGFLVKEQLWRSSLWCFSAFGIILWFALLSPMLLFLLSFSRLMVVVYPMDTNFKRAKYVLKLLGFTFITSFSTSLMITLMVKFTESELSVSLCLPFVDPTNSFISVKMITWLVAMIQILTSVAIIVTHCMLVNGLIKSSKNIIKSKKETDSNTVLFMQLFIITISNLICWFPPNAIFLSAIFLSKYPIDLAIWTTVTALPFNSFLNPSVFVATALRKIVRSRAQLNT